MKITIINCFDTFNNRVKSVTDYFRDNRHIVEIIQSNFSHVTKRRIEEDRVEEKTVNVIRYKRNLSIRRMISHYLFSKKAYQKVLKNIPDILYVIVPPNSIMKFTRKIKKHNEVKLIYDINDLWPESFPIKNVKLLPPFLLWRNMRTKSINFADVVITECNLFRDHIIGEGYFGTVHNIYLSRDILITSLDNRVLKGHIRLLYLGSINHIIDIEKISRLIELLSSRYNVTLNIIGDGENRDKLIEASKKAGADVKYHGIIFDEQLKKKIICECDYGLNIMKDSLKVGLTMKSLDYFQYGLPFFNNIKHDTEQIVNRYQCGINVMTFDDLSNYIHLLDDETLVKLLRNGTKRAFNDNFSTEIYKKTMDSIFKERS